MSRPTLRQALAAAAALVMIMLASPGTSRGQSSFSRQPSGALVLYMLLEDLGYRAGRLSDVGRLSDELDVLVVLGESNPLYTKAAQRWAEGGKLVIFAPPLMDTSYCGEVPFGEVKVAREMVLKSAEHKMRVVGDNQLTINKAACQLKTPKTATALVASAGKPTRSLAFDHRVERGRLLVLAHADLVVNQRLNEDDLPVVLRRWLEEHAPAGARIAFLEQKRAGQFLEMLKRAKMMPTVLHSLVWLLLLFWVVGPRFGQSSPAADTHRRRFAQHARALGNLYLGANASRRALRQIAQRFAGRVLGAPTNAEEAAQQRRTMARLIATRTGRDQDEVARLLARVDEAATADARVTDPREVQRHFRLSQALAELQTSHAQRDNTPNGGNRGRAQFRR